MERCPKCGNKLSNIDVLCPRCGALVEVIQIRNSFIPPASVNAPMTRVERSRQKAAEEDFPGEVLSADNDTMNAETEADADQSFVLPEFNLPDAFFTPGLNAEEPADAAPVPAPEDEALPESRLARRARQRQWLELEEVNASQSTPEAELLKEAEELTSRSARRRAAAEADAAPDTAADIDAETMAEPVGQTAGYPGYDSDEISEEPVRRYRSRGVEREQPVVSKSVSAGKLPVSASILLWIMVTAAVFLGFFFLNRHVQTTYGSYAAFIREITNGKIELDSEALSAGAVEVETKVSKTDTGAPAHTFSVKAPGATSVRVLPTGDVFEMTDGQTTFTLPDEAIALALGVITYDSSFVEDGLNLDLTFGSSTRNYAIDPFELYLVSSDYTREAPLQTQSTISTDTVAVSLVVAPGATIFINNDNYSDQIGDDGRLSIDLPLKSTGENIFAIDVIQPGRQALKDSFSVAQQEAPTQLEPEAAYQRTSSDTFECRGTTEPGATLSAQLNGETFAGLVSETGSYSVACKVSGYGLYSLMLTAASADKADSQIEVAVERVPEPTSFMKDAQKKTVADVVKNASTLTEVGIQLVAKVENLTSEELAQKFSLVSGDSKLECYYYYQTSKLTADKEYTLYGMVDEAGGFYVMFAEPTA